MSNSLTHVIQVYFAKNFIEKTIGLIGKKNPHAIFFKTRFGIHTFGMQFPIDVLILDSKNNVVKCKENFKPNRLFLWNPKYNGVLELPEGTIKTKKIKINDKIDICDIIASDS